MSFLDDAKAAATMAIPGSGTPEPQRRVLDAMPIEELAGLWCSLQYLGMRDHTEEAGAMSATCSRKTRTS
jgi:hypothetical protein